jgi:2,3-dimethylmalate lyase
MTQNRLVARLGEGLQILPGVHNALSATLAKMAGARGIFITGAGISNNFLGEPDLGLLTFDQLRAHVDQVLLAVDIPVFVDFDAGYGDIKMAWRQAKQLIRQGVAGIFLEDQVQPKRCGHFEGKQVVPVGEMVAKISALREIDDDYVLVARTDAIAVEGDEAALERAHAYWEAGADVTFVEAPTSRKTLEKIGKLPWPQVINIVEGGKTPLATAAELKTLGFSIALYANFASRIAMRSMKVAYKSLMMQGDTNVLLDDMVSFQERQEIVHLPQWEEFENRFFPDIQSPK